MHLIDEINDNILKLKSICCYKELVPNMIEDGQRIIEKCNEEVKGSDVLIPAKIFIEQAYNLYLSVMVFYYQKS